MTPQHEATIHDVLVALWQIPDMIGQMPAITLLWISGAILLGLLFCFGERAT